MWNLVRRFWHEESGAAGMEWAFVATILVLGAITGIIAARQDALGDPNPPVPGLTR
jgi:Flp pilus assembly pilin Flp